jgi:hypothetical protein
MEIKWKDIDPDTNERRQIRAQRFARQWSFACRSQRGEQWDKSLTPTLGMWEELLDGLERRYRRREGVSDEDIADVKRIIGEVRQRSGA